MDLKQLNNDFGVPGQLEFIRGQGGLPAVVITNGSARALVSLYAGQVLSFQPSNEPEDLLFLSQAADYFQGKAIRGGIPLCWPWFGPDPDNLKRPNHGFARISPWTVVGAETHPDETKLRLRLLNFSESKGPWPDEFELNLSIGIGKTLTLELETNNLSSRTFAITQAFHAYFKIGHIGQVQVLGLEGHHYWDKLAGNIEKKQITPLGISEEVDRIYAGVQHEVTIDDTVFNRRIRVSSRDAMNAMVWNPWIKKSATMSDLGPEDYKHFLCVESGNVASDAVEIRPGGKYKLRAEYSIERN